MVSELSPTQLFEFPPPLSEANIQSVRTTMLENIPPHEVLKRQYFENCFDSLLDYAIKYKKQTKNFSMSIGQFIPNFRPGNVDEGEIWSEKNIWVKVRVLGGISDAFRSRFMATQLGLAKIDWRRKTFRSLKKRSAKMAAALESLMTTGSSKPGLEVGENVIQQLDKNEKSRANKRLSSVTYSPERLFSQMATATMEEFQGLVASGEVVKVAEIVFGELTARARSTITKQEIMTFVTTVLSLSFPLEIFQSICYQSIGDFDEVNLEQFSLLFQELIRTEIEAKATQGAKTAQDATEEEWKTEYSQ